MKKALFSLLFAILMLGMFASAASATTINNPDEPNLNKVVPNDANDHNPEVDSHENITTNKNANNTTSGINQDNKYNEVIKSTNMRDNLGAGLKNQKTHGSYQNNTNSCASCHQTHTANAKNLLFADSVYNTCAACHDGTLGFYNVFENGKDYFNSEATAGTFGGTHSGNMSMHLATGAVAIKAAPGGNKNATSGSWTEEFNCASCHSPHGSYSDRLLHYNPNHMGNAPVANYGNQATNIDVVAFANKAATGTQLVVGTPAEHGIDLTAYNMPATNKVAAIYVNGVRSSTPWLYGYGTRSSDNTRAHNYWSMINKVATPDVDVNGWPKKTDVIVHDTAGVYFKYDKGLVYSLDAAGETALDATIGKKANIGRAMVVKMTLVQTKAATDPLYDIVKTHNVTADIGRNNVNAMASASFCSACHTDYLAGSGNPSGVYDTTKFRHTTNNGSYTCVLCHYAHGTDVEIMADGKSQTVHSLELQAGWDATKAREYMKDKNPSSALKKFTNMSGCWACHNSSHAEQLKNTNRDKAAPSGYIADPSTYVMP